jgi:hypothetical protein
MARDQVQVRRRQRIVACDLLRVGRQGQQLLALGGGQQCVRHDHLRGCLCYGDKL